MFKYSRSIYNYISSTLWSWALQASEASRASQASGVRAQIHCTCIAYHALWDPHWLRELRARRCFGSALAWVSATFFQKPAIPLAFRLETFAPARGLEQNLSSRLGLGTKPELPLEVWHISSAPARFQPLSLEILCSRSAFDSKREVSLEVCHVSCAPARVSATVA